jgi:hypothetical protein
MYRNRLNNLSTSVIEGIQGNPKAASFIKNVVDGTQSLDIVIFGDSNAGSGSSCGYTRGWSQSLAAFGAPVYGTPLMISASEDGGNIRNSGLFMPANYFSWGGRSTAGAVGTSYTLSARCRDGNASAIELDTTLGGYFVREGQATGSSVSTITLDAGASATNDFYKDCFVSILTGANGTVTTNWAVITAYNGTTKVATAQWPATSVPATNAYFLITKFLLKPGAFTYGAAFIDPAATFTSSAGGPSVRTAKGNQLTAGNGSGGMSCQYRLVYGKFSATGGKFRLRAMKDVNTTVAADSTDRLTSGGSAYDVAKLPFTSSTTSSIPDDMKCAWDGYNAGVSFHTTGPFAAFWHSIIRLGKKGFCTHNLNYLGGSTTAQHALTISRMGEHLKMYLKELRERQIEAGGSGRVLWFFNSGINGPDTATTWTDNMTIIRDTISATWISLGYPMDDLAFIMSVSHPTTSGDPGATTWATGRAAVSNAANLWALTAESFAKNVCVFDIESVFTSAQLKERNLYQILNNVQYQSHLQEGPTQGGTTPAEYKWNGPDGNSTTHTYNNYALDAVTTNNGYVSVITGLLRKLLQLA